MKNDGDPLALIDAAIATMQMLRARLATMGRKCQEQGGRAMSENERLAHWMLNWIKQHPDVRHQRWVAEPDDLQLALSRAKELRRAELRNQ